ncbi:ABC transporter permease [Metabacillus dongyingensis]|uniref:ABC transporter permease n=1 Tax=Metabacillus dongyingensis TaxID=2874282 RepID=UPI003B8D4F39
MNKQEEIEKLKVKLGDIQAQLQLQAQLQKQLQAQAQTQNDTDIISNVGNPVVNVNVSSTSTNGAGDNEPESAFRAEKNEAAQPIVAGAGVFVDFPNEIFDLNNEYNPVTSIFTPTQTGVYSICANVSFLPNNPTIDHATNLSIQVNGIQQVSSDNFFIGGVGITSNVNGACTIVQLQPGDTVRVVFLSTVDGIISSVSDTNFEAARFPS